MSFLTYFLVPKSSAHFSNTQNTPGLQKKGKKRKAGGGEEEIPQKEPRNT